MVSVCTLHIEGVLSRVVVLTGGGGGRYKLVHMFCNPVQTSLKSDIQRFRVTNTHINTVDKKTYMHKVKKTDTQVFNVVWYFLMNDFFYPPTPLLVFHV